MKRFFKHIVGFVGLGFVFGAAFAVFAPDARSAKYEWYLGTICKPQISDTSPIDLAYAFNNPVTATQGTYLEHLETTQGFYACPLPDETGLTLGSITHANLEVYDGSGAAGVHGKVCGMYQSSAGTISDETPAGSGHSCGFTGGTSNPVGGRGNWTISMNVVEAGLPALQNDEIGYVWVRVPGKDSGFSASRLYRLAFNN